MKKIREERGKITRKWNMKRRIFSLGVKKLR
jgi:hypothetical protein